MDDFFAERGPWALVALLLLLFGLAAVRLGVWLARLWRGWRARWRARVAMRGELDAEKLLSLAGWRVVGRQLRRRRRMWIDGESVEVELRADLLVERGGERRIAEVKTGSRVPDPAFPGTRRQLTEYVLVFGGDVILLVDVPAREIHEVRFDDLDGLDS